STGSDFVMQAFDASGKALSPLFTAFKDAPLVEPTVLTAHDVDGDGKTDFVSAFQSRQGITGNVTEFSLASGSALRQYSANVGSMADLSGVWDNGSQLVSIAQDGQNLTITVGGTSQSYLLSGVNVFLVQGNNTTKVAVLDHEVLRWVNGTTWEQIDL